MGDLVVKVQDLSKRFKLYDHPWHRALEWVSMGRVSRHADHWALKDVTFQVERGECLGIIGPNGAGKTTLLKILSRSLYPTGGNFEITGRVISLLELGTGFHPDLTGIQNIHNSARLLGFSEDDVSRRLKAILDFAELGDFIDRPLSIYSSGMYVRLAFSLFACLDPDVYVIDEALAVGDSSFQKKCVDRIHAMLRNGVTVLFVSHDLWRVEALCHRAIYLDHGMIKSCGAPNAVVKFYLSDVEQKAAGKAGLGASEPSSSPDSGGEAARVPRLMTEFEMFANSPLVIRRFWLRDLGGHLRTEFDVGEDLELVLEYECQVAVKEPVFRVVFALADERRIAVVGWYPGPGRHIEAGSGRLLWRIEGGVLYPRRYVLHASVASTEGVAYDAHYGACELQIATRETGPLLRSTDDLAANLTYTVEHSN